MPSPRAHRSRVIRTSVLSSSAGWRLLLILPLLALLWAGVAWAWGGL